MFRDSVALSLQHPPIVNPEPHRHSNNIPHHPPCDWCRGCIVGMCMALSACGDAPRIDDPINLSKAKEAVTRYCDSGAYDREIATVSARALAWIEDRASRRQPGERLALILDIDETALSNAPLIRRLDYAFIPQEWEAWTKSASAPAIGPVRDLYVRARQLGVAVIFLTGRREEDRERTIANLRQAGMGEYEALVLANRPDKHRTSAERKLEQRGELAKAGWVIIANIGDQDSDLRGGGAERSFKLPNPFYLME